MPLFSDAVSPLLRLSLIALLLAPSACMDTHPSLPRALRAENELLRANPGDTQWLEQQSLLHQSEEIQAVVSGTSLQWSASGTQDSASLLQRADVWLELDPSRAAAGENIGQSFLAALRQNLPPQRLHEVGIDGILLTDALEGPRGWDGKAHPGTSTPESRAATGLRFASSIASKDKMTAPSEEYALFDADCAAASLFIGGDMLPCATGMGRDFQLACMGRPRYADLYMMMDIARDLWPLLPDPPEKATATDRRDPSTAKIREGVTPLSRHNAAVLTSEGILPPPFARDMAFSQGGGWAATAEVRGHDGVTRRWVYRHNGDLHVLPLNWDAARALVPSLLSASILRQTGLLHQPLIRLDSSALMGLDIARTDGFSVEPALSASAFLARQIHRNGAWALLKQRLPLALIADFQQAGLDFVADSVCSPALEYAVISGDTAALARNLDASQAAGVDHARLWRSTPAVALEIGEAWLSGTSEKAIINRLDHQSPAWSARLLHSSPELDSPRLLLSAPTVAAIAAGLTPERFTNAISRPEDLTPAEWQRFRDIHLLQIAFRAFQPGALVLTGYDLAGSVLVDPSQDGAGDGALPLAWSVTGRPGLASSAFAGRAAYDRPDIQLHDKHSFLAGLQSILTLRQKSGVAAASYAGRALSRHEIMTGRPDSVLATVSRLPDGSHLLLAANFSEHPAWPLLFLPEGVHASRATGLKSGQALSLQGNRLSLHMEGWTWYAIRLHP